MTPRYDPALQNFRPTMKSTTWVTNLLIAITLLVITLWLRWPSFSQSLWNVDEAIHATAARTLLHGGVMYRDAIDQRTPLTYYVVAGIFALFGENNLWAVRCVVSVLIVATSFLLAVIGHRFKQRAGGMVAALLYCGLASAAFFPGDAFAINTEWFVAFFTTAAATVILTNNSRPTTWHCLLCGSLLGCAFLSKQPALLEVAAPVVMLSYTTWLGRTGSRWLIARIASGLAGWLLVVLAAVLMLVRQGAWTDAIFYTWSYNLHYYAPETTLTGRLAALIQPIQLFAEVSPALVVAWFAGAITLFIRLLQRQPHPCERPTNPGFAYLAVWSVISLAAAASSGRDFQHYGIQFLPAFCLGAGLSAERILRISPHPRLVKILWRIAAVTILITASWQFAAAGLASRTRPLPEDSSARISAYIRAHSKDSDRVFVWGYQPDIYFLSNRLPASRFLYASFLTGLVPWTNIEPNRDTRYAIVPGAMDDLLDDLHRHSPQFIVDCSVGPNRHWDKYPPQDFPLFDRYLQQHYTQIESEQFVPQGFRLFERRTPSDIEPSNKTERLPKSQIAPLTIGVTTTPLTPRWGEARFGVATYMKDGRKQIFAHAPSHLVYNIPPETSALRGGIEIGEGAYAPDNANPTDGAEFIIRWRPSNSEPVVLLRQLLRPKTNLSDRGLHSFYVKLPPHNGGELELITTPGPTENNASDWTFWSDLTLEKYH